MRLLVRLDDAPVWAWHAELVSSLEARENTLVGLDWVRRDAFVGEWRDAQRLFAVQKALHRAPGASLAPPPHHPVGDPTVTADDADVILDLSERPLAHPRCWSLEYDGEPGSTRALRTVLARRMPLVRVVTNAGEVVAQGRPGTEFPGVDVTALEDLLAGCTTLVLKALDRHPAPALAPLPEDTDPARRSPGQRLARTVVSATVSRAYRTVYRAPHWRVGWRFVDGPDVLDLLGHPDTGWHDLPDDGHHFYADPFPVEHEGRQHLFVEDYDHRLKRGVISVVEFGTEGPLETPHRVLDHDVHLSYPHVFEADGEMWMVPETSGARRIELYRARAYPDRWLRETVLVDGLEASDATLFLHEGRWWMTATVRHGGSYSDSLHLWYAEHLTGPWTPHRHNPVLVDIATARPGGGVVHRAGRLLRPVQDGRGGYGASMAVMEVTALDEGHFDQQLVALLTTGERWPGRRLHTLNRSGSLECIDGSAYSPRYARRSRSG